MIEKREYICPDGHSFDIAKEDYVNLLVSSKNGELKGIIRLETETDFVIGEFRKPV